MLKRITFIAMVIGSFSLQAQLKTSGDEDWSISYPEKWTLKTGKEMHSPHLLFKILPPGPDEAWKPVIKAEIAEEHNGRDLVTVLHDYQNRQETVSMVFDIAEVVDSDPSYAVLESRNFGSANNSYSTIIRYYLYKDMVLHIEFVCESYQWDQFNKIAREIMDSFSIH